MPHQFNNIKNLTILTTKKKHLHLIELKELKKENQELKQLIKINILKIKPHILFILLAVLILFTTCKKYPQGGFLRQGPKAFVTNKNGLWKLKLYEVNCIDSTGLIPIPITFGNDYFNEFLSCDYINKKQNENLYCSNHNYNYLSNFINKNKQITFVTLGLDNTQCQNTSSGISCQRNILNPEGIGLVTFTILKLRDKECILTTTLKNNYKIILTR